MGLVGFGLWCFVTNALHREALRQHAWVGGLVGMITVGMLAWVAFRVAVMIFTSVQGSIMVVSGISALLLAYQGTKQWLLPHLQGNPLVLSLLIGVPATVGFALQHAKETAKIKKKRKTTEKPPV